MRLSSIHEAAHVVAYHSFGAYVDKVLVEEDYTGFTSVKHFSYPTANFKSNDDLVRKIINYGIICLIGRIAEFVYLDAILGLDVDKWYYDSISKVASDELLDDGTELVIQFSIANTLLDYEKYDLETFKKIVSETINFLDETENWDSIVKLADGLQVNNYILFRDELLIYLN